MRVRMWNYDVEVDESVLDAPESEIRRRVREYRRGERRTFDFEVDYPETLVGDVMAAMSRIPYGETRTYGELAAELGTSPVAVGQACGRNPVPLVVPCHRVVAADSLGGFSADGGVDLKRRLLALEAGESLSLFGRGAD